MPLSTTRRHRYKRERGEEITYKSNKKIMDAATVNRSTLLLLPLLLLLSSLAITSSSPILKAVGDEDDGDQCVYTVYIRTGSIWKGGTDSVISLALVGADGLGVLITDLESWGGLMEPGHNYYERGNLDIFSGRGPCMSSLPCWMNLTSDGSGSHHGWYCNYVEVTTTGPHKPCAQQQFTVEQWLARDAAPYQLYATRNLCPAPEASGDGGAGMAIRKTSPRPLMKDFQ